MLWRARTAGARSPSLATQAENPLPLTMSRCGHAPGRRTTPGVRIDTQDIRL